MTTTLSPSPGGEPSPSQDGAAGTATAGPVRPPRRGGNVAAIVTVLALVNLAFAVLQSLVAPALSTIGADLGDSANIGWAMTAYLLSASVLTPILGRLGDMVGKRKVLIGVLIVMLAGVVVAALATNVATLVVGRVLQGAAGAVLPLAIGMVRDELSAAKVPTVIGILSGIAGVGAAAGIVAAGPIVEHLSWHWLFWLPGGLALLGLIGALFILRESPSTAPGRLDWLGSLLLSAALVALLVAISKGQEWGWSEPKTLWMLIGGAAALAVFVLIELRVKEPLVDMRLFRQRGVWTSNLVAAVVGFVMFGTFVLLPTLLQLPAATGLGFGKTVSEAGLFLLPTVGAMVVFSPLAGAMVNKLGAKVPMALGGVLLIVAFVLPALAHDELWQIVLSGSLVGAGMGLALSASTNAVVAGVSDAQTGEASSVNTIARTIGGSIGTAVVSGMIASQVTEQGMPTDAAFTSSFWVLAAGSVVAVVAALVVPATRRRARTELPAAGQEA